MAAPRIATVPFAELEATVERLRAERKLKAGEQRTCACGTTFNAQRQWQWHCSTPCRLKYHKLQRQLKNLEKSKPPSA